MNMRGKIFAAVLIASGAPLLAGAADAAPLSNPLALKDATAQTASVEAVQWRRHRHYHGYHGRRGGWGGPAVAGAIIGGAIIGSAIASQNSYNNAVGYCMQRFRSYDPASGTYLGYDGFRHPCP